MPPRQQLGELEEKARYALHDNTTANSGYIGFLKETARVIDGLALANPRILDFGSGEHAVLEHLLVEQGISCVSFDPLYDIGRESLDHTYDVVVACEVVEHFRDPSREFELLGRLVKAGGYLIVRTQIRPIASEFSKWWYKEDPTHIMFYSVKTMEFVAGLASGEMRTVGQKGIWVIRKNADAGRNQK